MRNVSLAALFACIWAASSMWSTGPATAQGSASLVVPLMSPQDLRKCAVLARNLELEQAAVHDEDERLFNAGMKIKEGSTALDILRAKTDPQNARQAENFTAKATALQASIERYNDWVARRNARGQRDQMDVNSYNVNCAQRPYSKDDLSKLPPEQRDAMNAHARDFVDPKVFSVPRANGSVGASSQNASDAFTIGTEGAPAVQPPSAVGVGSSPDASPSTQTSVTQSEQPSEQPENADATTSGASDARQAGPSDDDHPAENNPK